MRAVQVTRISLPKMSALQLGGPEFRAMTG